MEVQILSSALVKNGVFGNHKVRPEAPFFYGAHPRAHPVGRKQVYSQQKKNTLRSHWRDRTGLTHLDIKDRNVTATKSTQKPAKPYDGYPLFAHARGYWCKKFRGKQYNCGPWGDPTAALSRWHEIRNHLEVGNQPPAQKGDLTIEYVCNAFLDSCHSRVAS